MIARGLGVRGCEVPLLAGRLWPFWDWGFRLGVYIAEGLELKASA